MYRRDNQDADFKHLHVYKRIEKCEKWAEVRRALDKAKETYKPDAATPGASEGRPDGHKLAKKGKSADVATTRVPRALPRRRPGPGRPTRREDRGAVVVANEEQRHQARPAPDERRREEEEHRHGRSEERRVGKECRSRWSPYH